MLEYIRILLLEHKTLLIGAVLLIVFFRLGKFFWNQQKSGQSFLESKINKLFYTYHERLLDHKEQIFAPEKVKEVLFFAKKQFFLKKQYTLPAKKELLKKLQADKQVLNDLIVQE